MPITIKKNESSIKFYGSQVEPILAIYNGTEVAVLRDFIIDDVLLATEIAEAVSIASIFINSLTIDEKDFKRNNIDVTYLNMGDLSCEDQKYSARKVLNWLESNKIVTVNKKERIKYQFIKFAYQNDKLIILYKPVAW